MAVLCLLLWLPCLGVADQLSPPALSCWEVPGREYLSMGVLSDVTG